MHEVEKGLSVIEEYGSLGAAPDTELDGITKRCNTCNKRMPILKFHRYAGRSRDGFRPICIACRRRQESNRLYKKRQQQADERKAGIVSITADQLLPGDVLCLGKAHLASVVTSVRHGFESTRIKLDDGGKIRFLKDEELKVKRVSK